MGDRRDQEHPHAYTVACAAGFAALAAFVAGCDANSTVQSTAGAAGAGANSGQASTTGSATGARTAGPSAPAGQQSSPDSSALQTAETSNRVDLQDGEYPIYVTGFSAAPGQAGSITVDVIQFLGEPDLPTDIPNYEPNYEVYGKIDGHTYYVRNQNPPLRTIPTTSDLSIFNATWVDYHAIGDSKLILTEQFDETWWRTESGAQRPWIMMIRNGVVDQLVNAT